MVLRAKGVLLVGLLQPLNMLFIEGFLSLEFNRPVGVLGVDSGPQFVHVAFLMLHSKIGLESSEGVANLLVRR